jgi:HlyD family type I secretion membrane fusion protein
MTDLVARAAEATRLMLRPDDAVTGPADPQPEIRVGLIIAILFFVIFLGWAAFAPLDAGAYAPGDVVVSGSRQAVQHREGGVVSALHVREGDEVRQGQVLIEISADEVRAVERALTSEVISLQVQRARLQAERDRLPDLVVPATFATLPPEDRAIADAAISLQREQLRARRSALSSRRGVLNQQTAQLGQQIEGLNRQLSANSEQQALIADELKGVKELAARGYAPQTRVRALERAAADLRGTSGAYRASAAQAQEAIGQTRMEMITLDRGMTEEVIEQLRQTEMQLGELTPKLMAAREQVARALVRAPATGKVVGLSAFTVGGVIQPGQTLMEIVPKNAVLVIRARVLPEDADDLTVGQRTEIRIPAFHQRNLPMLQGEITEVSADSFVDEKTGQRFFTADVAVPPSETAKIAKVRGAAAGLRPGLPVEVVVPLRKRTALQYFFEPLQQSIWRSFREH